jgi:DNA-binding FrmR family transcriptional regulator
MAGLEDDHGGVDVDHSRQLPRLRRIEGQIRGLQQMIEGERPCGEVVQQINAAVAALRRVQTDMVQDHLQACVQASMNGHLTEKQRRTLAEDAVKLMASLARLR